MDSILFINISFHCHNDSPYSDGKLERDDDKVASLSPCSGDAFSEIIIEVYRIPNKNNHNKQLELFSVVGRAWNTSLRRHPGGVLIRCLNYLNWLLSMWRSSGSTPHPSLLGEPSHSFLTLGSVITFFQSLLRVCEHR